MDPRRILVTGAGGFVGGHLLPALRAALPKAVILGTSAAARGDLRALDVTDPARVSALIRELRPDACLHLAGITAIPAAREDPDRAWRVNLTGTLNLARAVLREAPACRFVYVSSAEVYGRSFAAGIALDEGAVPAPANTYAATKAAADLAIGAMASEGLRAIRLRPFNHTGPGQTAAFVVPAFARQLIRIEAGLQPPALRVGALDAERDFLDVRDVCAAYVACLRAPELKPALILNIASGTPRRIGDILRDLLALAGVEAEVATEGALLRPSEIPLAVGDAGRARRLLAWTPSVPWNTTLGDVLEDWRDRIGRDPAA